MRLELRTPVVRFGIAVLVAATLSPPSVPAEQPVQKSIYRKIQARVPFAGCKSDGQLGPKRAPSGKTKAMPLGVETAQRLAYYQAEYGPGVLRPRGWYCFGTYGSSGASLFVSPVPTNSPTLFSTNWPGFDGPVIQIRYEYGGTSGRFGVARIIARVFPVHRSFVEALMKEDSKLLPPVSFGAYPGDKLIYRTKEMVEYETPADLDGLGTESELKKDIAPITGVAILKGKEPDLLMLSIRLPSDLGALSPAIIGEVEREVERARVP